MDRREFVKKGAFAGVLGLSGCINPDTQPQPMNNTTENKTDDEDNFNDSETNEPSSKEPIGDSPHDVQIILENVGSTAWEVSAVNGADSVAETSTENPTLNLEVGTRYRIDNNGSPAHPLGFRGPRNTLLSQSRTGTFEDDNYVYWRDKGDYVEFTVTQELADQLDEYYCEIHSQMVGNIQV